MPGGCGKGGAPGGPIAPGGGGGRLPAPGGGGKGGRPWEKFYFRVEPGSRERGPTKSLRRPAETRRRHKPRSARRKMLGSEAEATWRRASARFIGRRNLVDDTLCLVVTKGWEKRKQIKIGVVL
jgi:hypothetical protein